MITNEYGLGCIEYHDPRDDNYPMAAILPEKPFITNKMWWDNGWWGDQKNTSMCTVYSWSHWLEDGPLLQTIDGREKPMFDLKTLYNKAQLNDGIPGTNYQGSTVRAVAKVFKELGVIKEYRWANSIDDIITCLLTIGPVVVGTKWYSAMFTPDKHTAIVKPEGGMAGGHAYVLNGVDTERKLFRIKNSWGKTYGQNGHAYISFDDFNKLFKDKGQACIAIANKLDHIPDMTTVQDNDVI